MLFAVTAAVALVVPASALAARPQPLNQYLVSHINPKALQRAGYDMQEAVTKSAKGKFAIVATPSQAAALRAKGAKVTAPFGVTRTRPKARRARARAAANPTHGYNVFRPWSLDPAPCPGTCATPNIPLKDWYHQFAAAHPDVVKEEVIGHSVQGQAIMAYKLTQNAQSTPDGSRPTVLYDSTQHAREWIATEVERRLFERFVTKSDSGLIKSLIQTRELWFIPMNNPDGYDYTFQDAGTRLWRKNLHDNNGDGQITNVDGVDMNRNWQWKWNYDLEGASNDFVTETFHGTGPNSEPEVQAIRGLEERIRPKFQIDYHSFAKLILYPEGWQVETPATDAPLMRALAGDSDKPAVAGFDPEVSAQLYTTNGDITGDALRYFDTQSYTVELDGGTGGPAGGTDGSTGNFTPGGFVFQDSETDVQAEFQKNWDFALDLARSATDPDDPVSHLNNTAPAMVPTKFATSTGNPQTVEVNAKRSLGAITAHWTINGGAEQTGPTAQFDGGSRYGRPGVYYHRMRAAVTGTHPGDQVAVWFTGGGASTSPFTYSVRSDTGNPVLLMVAEDYTGNSALAPQSTTPYYLGAYTAALDQAGIAYDVYDVDAANRTAPSQLGVLSHYKAVVWETGNDLYVRNPKQPGGTGTRKLFDDEVMNARDYMNEGGKLLVAGQAALQGAWDQFLYNPLGDAAKYCPSNQTSGNGQSDAPKSQNFPCIAVSNDFMQYWLGAYQNGADNPNNAALHEVPPVGETEFGLNGTDSAQNQQQLVRFLTTSSVLPESEYPDFASDTAIVKDGPPAYDPPEGTHYMYSQVADQSYKRLTTTVDLTGHSTGSLSFKLSYDTEPNFDYVFVEAHTVGQDDWTTLPVPGVTSTDVGQGCGDADPFWLQLHPFLNHYLTRHTTSSGFACDPQGTSGTWNAATGNSGGFDDWNVDLSSFHGKNVEVSITYIQDPAVRGLGVFVDDATITADASQVAHTGFETEGDISPFTVPGPPASSPGNANDWKQSTTVGFKDGPGVRTDHSLYWGFGLEGVTGAATRRDLLKNALTYLGA